MKVDLDYQNETCWTIYIEPANEVDKCALAYLATVPKNHVKILITQLGLFKREEK